MVLFFYHGGIAQQVAFGETLRNGNAFASMLLDAILASSAESPLLSVATDGETFGHHHNTAIWLSRTASTGSKGAAA